MSDDDGAGLPRLGMLRELTDRRVLELLLPGAELTRAELAVRTGISKPTISESVRRLVDSGLLGEAGARTGRRGPSGTLYRVRPEAAGALAVTIGPDGVVAERYDLTGSCVGRAERAVEVPTDEAGLTPVLHAAVATALADQPAPVSGVAVSVAGPVDRLSGRMVALPDSPFLLGELAPAALLAPLLPGAPVVDNDVNWAAAAEHHEGGGLDLDDFFYAYLGPGLGGAVVRQGVVASGHRGLAGELAHVRTAGPRGRSLELVECFATWGLLRPGTAAIDVDRVREVLTGPAAADHRLRADLARAVAGALASVTALLNPAAVVVGGPWGSTPGWAEQVARALADLAAVPAEVRPAGLGPDAPLRGARAEALRQMRQRVGGGPPGPTSAVERPARSGPGQQSGSVSMSADRPTSR